MSDAEQLLQRLSVEGALSERLAFLHTRFGTPSRAIDVAAAATMLVMFVSGGRVQLARARLRGGHRCDARPEDRGARPAAAIAAGSADRSRRR